ncbi:PREDICTED: polygalacturonase-like [Tarenaya hassleriana]|uniref:polygalacturonase-like n=2 Tax=Tarenaya hassleriana TaxID=28532 RepID=UPI00053C771B|nr:PREDICTED: polygalacturonase-like [Tarenaya hassleriana]
MAAKTLASVLFALYLLSFSANAEVFDIRKFGTASVGSDITQALRQAFQAACQNPRPSSVVIPKGTYKLGEIDMVGPCKAPVEVTVNGHLQANGNALVGREKWVVFRYINGFKLNGAGIFDGQGNAAWKSNDCHKNNNCKKLPISIRFDFVLNGEVRDITSLDAKNFHVNVLGCKNFTFDNVKIKAPAESPNTDGIHLGRSDGVNILRSFISTGDDCISVGDGMKNLHVERVTCGPGHGISIGSLGRYTNEGPVAGIWIKNCTLQETDNGLRIKTYPSSASSITVSDIHFEDIIVKNVFNPILIDQEYCPWNKCNKAKPSTVKLVNISFKRIRGTSGNKDAVRLLCSKAVPCTNVEVGDIDLRYGGADGPATFQCSNVTPKLSGTQFPKACSSAMVKPLNDV